MTMLLSPDGLPLALAALAAGALSALLYGRKRAWLNAMLALVAGTALAALLAQPRFPAAVGTTATATALALATGANGGVDQASLLALPGAGVIDLSGDGLHEAEWRDLPARPLRWTPAAADLLWLDFPRTLALGRMFALTVRRGQPQPGWRLQLLAENRQVLAESTAGGAPAPSQLSVQWLPPVAETLLLQARLLDAAGKTIAEGPVPLRVVDAVPLQVQGRFDAASFDARALNRLLADGGALLDWQVTLGKAISRSDTARTPITAPNVLFADAAYIEQLTAPARAALLAQVAQGLPLVVLGGNAANAALWQRELGLRLQPSRQASQASQADQASQEQRQFSVAGAALSLPLGALVPAESADRNWPVLARDDGQRPWLWQRAWQRGRVIWLGVADWHRYAISAPLALTLWWQQTLDRIALPREDVFQWQQADPMPLPGLRSELCARGVEPGAVLHLARMPDRQWQRRADHADAACSAIWPLQAGWLQLDTRATDHTQRQGQQYIYASTDWPAWQRALRRDATARYAARASAAAATVGDSRPLPAAPFAVLFLLAMLGLWYREQGRG